VQNQTQTPIDGVDDILAMLFNDPAAPTRLTAGEVVQRLRTDFPFYARHCLRIPPKNPGPVVPLVLSKAQMFIHAHRTEQRRRRGMVRQIIVKGRQQFVSTGVESDIFFECQNRPGLNAYILAHIKSSTHFLFQKFHHFVKNYPRNLPSGFQCPVELADLNIFGLTFSNCPGAGNQITAGTAGSEEIGRGATIQYLHGSEAAFWEHGSEILAGLGNTIAEMPGTAIILESTANGMTNRFYEMCMTALEGKGSYEVVFIPWFWQPEYRTRLPVGERFVRTEQEEELVRLYSADGLTSDEQLFWYRNKMEDLGVNKTRQEYPCNIMEAFQTSGGGLFPVPEVIAARKSGVRDESAPLVFGVDPGRTGDRFVIFRRRGREAFNPTVWENAGSPMSAAGKLAAMIEQEKPLRVFIDTTNEYAFYDRLREMGYGRIVVPVHFAEKPLDETRYANKRAEMYGLLQDWLRGGELRRPGTVSIPDRDDLHAELSIVPEFKYRSESKRLLPGKDEIKRANNGRSPDLVDALVLTFAEPVRSEQDTFVLDLGGGYTRSNGGGGGSLSVLSSLRSADRTRKVK